MTANQFNRALADLGFTQVGFAKALQLGERSVRRWAAGQWPVPATISALLKTMIRHGDKAEDLKI